MLTRRRGKGRLVALSLSSLIVMALMGCSGVSVQQSTSLVIITDAGFLTGDEALVFGTLAATATGCVGIENSAGIIYPTVWPRGTTLVEESSVSIDIPGVGIKSLGDPIEGGGGYYQTSNRPALDEVAEVCDYEGEVAGIRFN